MQPQYIPRGSTIHKISKVRAIKIEVNEVPSLISEEDLDKDKSGVSSSPNQVFSSIGVNKSQSSNKRLNNITLYTPSSRINESIAESSQILEEDEFNPNPNRVIQHSIVNKIALREESLATSQLISKRQTQPRQNKRTIMS